MIFVPCTKSNLALGKKINLNGRSLTPVKLFSYIMVLPVSFDKMMMLFKKSVLY